MRSFFRVSMLIAGIILVSSPALADFDARYWAKFAGIALPGEGDLPPFGRVNLQSGSGASQHPDGIRIITRSKREIPLQIVTRRPEKGSTEIQAKVVNMSITPEKDTYFEGIIADRAITYNAVEVMVEGNNFFRQAQIFGGADGVNWSKIRSDAVIFDYSDDRRLRHTRITIPDTRYRHLKIIIKNKLEEPLKVTGMKIFHDRKDQGRDEIISAQINRQETDAAAKTSSVDIGLKYRTALHGIEIRTSDKNFRRMVDVFIKQDNNQWVKWGSDCIFNFEGEGMMESKTVVEIPEATAQDVRLVVRNMDSPPLKIDGVSARAYLKAVIFRIDGRDGYFMFWGNPNAKAPAYDIAGHVSKQDIDSISAFSLEETRDNPDYIGSEKSLPFTERYKYLLYILVALVIAGLGYYQYRVFKRTG
jgi:hypothetical protein